MLSNYSVRSAIVGSARVGARHRGSVLRANQCKVGAQGGAVTVSVQRWIWTRGGSPAKHFSSAVPSWAEEEVNSSSSSGSNAEEEMASGPAEPARMTVLDVGEAVNFYKAVLGLSLATSDDASFWPVCRNSPAFMTRGDATAALVRMNATQFAEKQQRAVVEEGGVHFSLQVSRDEFAHAQRVLPEHGVALFEARDYGPQLSLLFRDPDLNVVEITTWREVDDSSRP